jgi:hypothetical protein
MLVQADPADPDCADVMVPGSIGGRTYWFRLDTGAAVSDVVADEHLAGLTALRSHSSAGAFGQAAVSDIVVVRDLVLGELSIAEMEVRRVPAGADRQNLLGMDVLGRHCCRFRFDAGLLELTGSPADRDQLTLDLTMDDRGHPYVQLDWTGAGTSTAAATRVSASACFDSGGGITVVDRAFRDRHPELFTAAGQTAGTDSTGAGFAGPAFWLAGPSIAGTAFPPAKVAVLDLAPVNRDLEFPMDVILGAPTISHANWLFDFPARRMAVPQLVSS